MTLRNAHPGLASLPSQSRLPDSEDTLAGAGASSLVRALVRAAGPSVDERGREGTVWKRVNLVRAHASWPQSAIMTAAMGLSPGPFLFFSIALTRLEPSMTSPKTTCLLSSQGVAMKVQKNWEPFVLGPALAMDSMKGFVCFSSAGRRGAGW